MYAHHVDSRCHSGSANEIIIIFFDYYYYSLDARAHTYECDMCSSRYLLHTTRSDYGYDDVLLHLMRVCVSFIHNIDKSRLDYGPNSMIPVENLLTRFGFHRRRPMSSTQFVLRLQMSNFIFRSVLFD